jgi:cobaltochelatase CobS
MSETDAETILAGLAPADLDAGLIFSGQTSGRLIRGFTAPCAYTPSHDPFYVFPEAMRELVVWLMAPADPLYVFGPTGSGKSSLIRQVAAKLNYPVFEITGHGRLEFADLAGHLSVDRGSMRFQHGPLALAMRYGGLFLLNEIDLLDPAVAVGLNGVLDGAPLCLPENGGEIIAPHPLFRFVATANTNGAADETGLYQGTLRQNLAFMDRFTLCEIGYPSAETERSLLDRRTPALPESLRATMVDYAHQVRRLFLGDPTGGSLAERIEVTFSTRTLLRWADLTQRFQPLARTGIQPVTYALDRALGYRATPPTRALLQELAQRLFAVSA